jgi:hypothetical protein
LYVELLVAAAATAVDIFSFTCAHNDQFEMPVYLSPLAELFSSLILVGGGILLGRILLRGRTDQAAADVATSGHSCRFATEDDQKTI